MINGKRIKNFIERFTGYWVYKKKYLPYGISLKLDITNRFNYNTMDVIFDVGANIGQTFDTMRADFPQAKIYCFEPIFDTYKLLVENVAKSKHIVLENFAFGAFEGQQEVRLYENDTSNLNSLKQGVMNKAVTAKTQHVIVKTINAYCVKNNIKHIDILKIDTEGYELEVLKGAESLLSSHSISFILCEVGFLHQNHRNTNFSVLCEYLARFNYNFVALHNVSGWKDHIHNGNSYGNALFVSKSLEK